MRFLDIDDVEGNAVPVVIVEPVEGGNLPPKGWSRIASEDQDLGALAEFAGKLHEAASIEGR
jgi:hypothetical protein